MSIQVDAKPGLDIETRLFIGGDFVDSVEGARIPVTNPHDNSILAEVSEARPADIDRAVEDARKAFPARRGTGSALRASAEARSISAGRASDTSARMLL